jgi:hypothetical protein
MKHINSENLDWHESDYFQQATPAPGWKPNLEMALFWLFIAGVAGVYLVCEWVVSVVLSIGGGWANGWPGLSSRTVLSTVITVLTALFLMTAAAGAGAIAGFLEAVAGVRQKRQIQVYCWWLCIAAVAILCLSVFIFRSYYEMSGDEPRWAGQP